MRRRFNGSWPNRPNHANSSSRHCEHNNITNVALNRRDPEMCIKQDVVFSNGGPGSPPATQFQGYPFTGFADDRQQIRLRSNASFFGHLEPHPPNTHVTGQTAILDLLLQQRVIPVGTLCIEHSNNPTLRLVRFVSHGEPKNGLIVRPEGVRPGEKLSLNFFADIANGIGLFPWQFQLVPEEGPKGYAWTPTIAAWARAQLASSTTLAFPNDGYGFQVNPPGAGESISSAEVQANEAGAEEPMSVQEPMSVAPSMPGPLNMSGPFNMSSPSNMSGRAATPAVENLLRDPKYLDFFLRIGFPADTNGKGKERAVDDDESPTEAQTPVQAVVAIGNAAAQIPEALQVTGNLCDHFSFPRSNGNPTYPTQRRNDTAAPRCPATVGVPPFSLPVPMGAFQYSTSFEHGNVIAPGRFAETKSQSRAPTKGGLYSHFYSGYRSRALAGAPIGRKPQTPWSQGKNSKRDINGNWRSVGNDEDQDDSNDKSKAKEEDVEDAQEECMYEGKGKEKA